jgi:peptidoglycan/xylan/chitin deacetylase (PgdA/CDA1 family)
MGIHAGAQAWARLPKLGRAMTVLAYQRVDTTDDVATVPPETFCRHIELLYEHRGEMPIVDVVEGLTKLVTSDASARSAAVTFDGAYTGTHEHALVPLMQHRIPATMFVSSRRLGSSGYISKAGLRDLGESGVVVGSHGQTGADLRGRDDPELEREVRGSKDDLEDLVGTPVTTFSYPVGGVDARVRQAVVDAGYAVAVTTRRGSVTSRTDSFSLSRQTVAASFDGPTFMATVRGGMDVMRVLPSSLLG